jgi:geranylgeranyl diphosphate synthase, type I
VISVAPAPASLATLAGRVDERLRTLLAAEEARWSAFDSDLAEPVAEIGRLVLAGGKRLRPAFCHWGYVAAGGNVDDHADTQAVVDAGAAFELMHAFALFHDDVMDDASTRRGQPTSHTVYRDRHAAEQWAGESRRFGEGAAILIGDLAFVYADQMLHGANATAWQIWNELRVELNMGQFLDILGGVRNERRREKAERICRYKSGKYTIERPLHLGAALAAPDRDDLRVALSAYGLPLGDAFQMRDDVMGAFGDEATTGKPVGGDLREGKPTPLMAIAVAAASDAQRRVLNGVGRPDMTDDDVARIQQVIVETGALAEQEALIASLTDQAIDAIRSTPINPVAIDELVQLAYFVSQRTV